MKRELSLLILSVSICFCAVAQNRDVNDTNNIAASAEFSTSTFPVTKSKSESIPSKEYRPELGIGLGYFSFYGDVRTTDSRSMFASPIVYSFYAARRITDALDLGLRFSTGKIIGNETGPDRYLNFQSILHTGSAYLAYDFSNFFKPGKILKPYLTVGFSVFDFNNKGDLFDANGNEYHYWSDGSIRNMAESAPGATNAVRIQRDYTYETDLRKANLDGFGTYRQVGFGIPVGLEFEFNISSRSSFRLGSIFTYSLTDLLDNVTEESSGPRAGKKGGDHFLQNKISFHYDLFNKLRKVEVEDFEFVDYLALDYLDDDKDKVINEFDLCPFTLEGLEVDQKGCPLDIDEDGIADYKDKDNGTLAGADVNEQGIALADEDYLFWYMRYIDSLDVPVEVLEKIAGIKEMPKSYRVFVKEFEPGTLISDDALSQFSQEKDVKVFTDKNQKTIYTVGDYYSVAGAEQRKKEVLAKGIETAEVVVFDEGEMMKVADWERLAQRQIRDRFKNDFNKVRALEGMYAVKLGSVNAGSNAMDKGRYLRNEDVITLDGRQGGTDYVMGPFIDTVSAAQNVKEYQAKGFLSAEIVVITAGVAKPLHEPESDEIAQVTKEDVGDFEKLSYIDGKLVVKVGTIDKHTPYDEKQKLLNDSSLIAVENSDRSTDFVFPAGYDTKMDARKQREELKEKGFKNAQVATVAVDDTELKLRMEEQLVSNYSITLGVYEKGVPTQEMNKILSVKQVKEVQQYDPAAKSYNVGVFDRKEGAKLSFLELASQGYKASVVKYEGEKPLALENSEVFDRPEELSIVNGPQKGGAVKTNSAVFRVKVGSFKNIIPQSRFRDMDVLSFAQQSGGKRQYFSEGKNSYRDAYIDKLKLKKLGFEGIEVVAYKDGKNIPLKDLVNDQEMKTVQEELGTGELELKDNIVYKVQVGAFKDFSAEHNKLRKYEHVEMEIYGEYKRILTGRFATYPEAVAFKEEIIKTAGYPGAFVVAYDGKTRLAPKGVNPNVVNPNEGGKDLVPQKVPGLVIMVQIGLFKGALPADVNEKFNTLDRVTKEVTPEGITRYLAGRFQTPEEATAYKEELRSKGFSGAFLVAYYNSNKIDIKKAVQLAQQYKLNFE